MPQNNCSLCGEPMLESDGTMFNYHGYARDCPKPPLKKEKKCFCDNAFGKCPIKDSASLPDQRTLSWEKEFDRQTKKTFLNGGLMLIQDYPPHNWILGEKEIKSFISQTLQQSRKQDYEMLRENIKECIRYECLQHVGNESKSDCRNCADDRLCNSTLRDVLSILDYYYQQLNKK